MQKNTFSLSIYLKDVKWFLDIVTPSVERVWCDGLTAYLQAVEIMRHRQCRSDDNESILEKDSMIINLSLNEFCNFQDK